MKDGGFGILVVDAHGVVQFASGAGADVRVQKAIFANAARGKPLSTVSVGEDTFCVSARRTEEADAYFIHHGEPEDALVDFMVSVPFAAAILRHFIDSPFEAITVVDADARLRFMSPVHEAFFGLKRGEGRGRPVTDVIENTRLHEVVATGRAEIGHVQEMKGVRRVVTRIPIMEDGKVVGAIGQVMFKEPQQLIEMGREVSKLRTEVGLYRREVSELRERTYGLEQIIGQSDAVRQLKADILRIAPLDVPVLLLGESGTGKELTAQAIHMLSPRRDKSMVLVNAAALPATLVESELFGYEPGSFTGAERKGRTGKFEQAHASSLFLDEIGDMPIDIQAKLLRVLEDGRFERIGGDRIRHSDFRLISATNRDLDEMIAHGRFRLDVYYRISAVVLRLPPLRERLEDIPTLVQAFVEAYNRRHGTHLSHVADGVFDYLKEHAWPGNVRQLQHEVERAIIFSSGNEIAVRDFRIAEAVPRVRPVSRQADNGGTIGEAVGTVERTLIAEAMERFGGNKKRVALELGISRSYLYKKLEALDMH